MGCGCGRSGKSAVSLLNETNTSNQFQSQNQSQSQEVVQITFPPEVQGFKPIVPVQSQAQTSASPMSQATGGILGDLAAGTKRLGGIPMLRKRSADSSASATEIAADQTSVPVAKRSSYNIINVIKDTLTGDVMYADNQMAKNRLEVCHACPHLMAGACTKCGCVVRLKVKYEESSCPIGKW
jgi:hypothetical protein